MGKCLLISCLLASCAEVASRKIETYDIQNRGITLEAGERALLIPIKKEVLSEEKKQAILDALREILDEFPDTHAKVMILFQQDE